MRYHIVSMIMNNDSITVPTPGATRAAVLPSITKRVFTSWSVFVCGVVADMKRYGETVNEILDQTPMDLVTVGFANSLFPSPSPSLLIGRRRRRCTPPPPPPPLDLLNRRHRHMHSHHCSPPPVVLLPIDISPNYFCCFFSLPHHRYFLLLSVC